MRNKRKKERIMSLVMALAMSLTTLGGVATSTLQVKAAATVSNPRIADDGTVTWDKITFGSYPQDLKEITTEPIKWRILDINGDDAFLLADEALDCKQYNEIGVEKNDSDGNAYTDYSCTWETCTLRDWLNGTDSYANDDTAFIKAAFSDEERKDIIETTVVNDDNEYYGTEGGNNTIDMIYLLSIREASNSDYGFIGNFDASNVRASRNAKATDYAFISGASRGNSYEDAGNGYWWLRSPGSDAGRAGCVYNGGWGNFYAGDPVDCATWATRPVLHVKLTSPYVTDAGSVTSEETVTAGTNRSSSGYSVPSTTNGVTTWDCVYFGHYKQDASFEKKPIEWRVLSVSGNDAFVVADKALDCKDYNKRVEGADGYSDYTCTWETCTLRDWLNGTDDYASDDTAFINVAFTDDEKKAIIETDVANEDKPSNNTEGGNNTIDKIFLLSIEEAIDTSYGFEEIIEFTDNETRKAKATYYAYLNGAYLYNNDNYVDNCIWWLRSPITNKSSYYGARVIIGGSILGIDDPLDCGDPCVRPALHVDLSSSYVKAAGTVSTESKLTVENREEQKKADEVIVLISTIGTVTKDSKNAIDAARSAYNALSINAKAKVTNYSVLQAAETKYAELIKNDSGNGGLNNNGNAGGTTGGNTDKPSDGDAGGNTAITPATTEVPATTETPSKIEPSTEQIVAPAKVKITFVKNSVRKSIVIKWKKVSDAKGYEVAYALNNKFTKSKKTKTLSKTSFTASKFKKGKTYYVRVRAYNEGADGNKVYGKWSTVKKVKIKK